MGDPFGQFGGGGRTMASGGIDAPDYPCKNDWWGRSLVPEILYQTDRIGVKCRSAISFRSYSDSAATPSEKGQLTLIGSPLRAFHR